MLPNTANFDHFTKNSSNVTLHSFFKKTEVKPSCWGFLILCYRVINFMLYIYRVSPNSCLQILKGDLKAKLDPCVYSIFSLILWRKSLAQSFAAFSSDFTYL